MPLTHTMHKEMAPKKKKNGLRKGEKFGPPKKEKKYPLPSNPLATQETMEAAWWSIWTLCRHIRRMPMPPFLDS